jgi:uncharacterized protein
MRVLIAGASGLLGSAVAGHLREDGHEIVRLVRQTPGPGEVGWNPDAGVIDGPALEGFDAVINVASMPWSGRWTAGRKRRIHDNRVGSYRLLADALAARARPPRVLACASGMGIYAPAGDAPITEEGALANDFVGSVQQDGEAATASAAAAGIRVAHLRLPMVLGGPNLSVFTRSPRRFGDGRQWNSWIALSDVPRVVDHVIAHDDLTGPINTCSPESVRNAEFATICSRVVGRKPGRPLPAILLRLALGEMADALVLASRRMEPTRLLASGFRFEYPDLESALRHELAVGSPEYRLQSASEGSAA